MSTGESPLTTSSQLEGASLPGLPVNLPGDGDAPAESGISGVAAPQEPAPVQAPSKPAYSLPLSSGAKQPVHGKAQKAWKGLYTRDQLLALRECEAAKKIPPDLPTEFIIDSPGNVADRAKAERAARKKDDKDKEKERRDRAKELRDGAKQPGSVPSARASGADARAPDAPPGAQLPGGPGAPGQGAAVERQQGSRQGGAREERRGGGGSGWDMPDSGASNQQHLRMMEEVERERAAFAAERARAKGAGAPSAPAPQQPPAGSAPARPVAVDLSGDANTDGAILNMFLQGDTDGEMLGGPVPADPLAIPAEASPSKFQNSRAGRWFAVEGSPESAPGPPPRGRQAVPDAVASLWKTSAQVSSAPGKGMRPPRIGGEMQQGGPGGSGAGIAPTPPRQPPTTEELAAAGSALGALLNIGKGPDAPSLAQDSTKGPPEHGAATPESKPRAEAKTPERGQVKLPTPVAPLRTGQSLLSKLLSGESPGGQYGAPMPNLPSAPSAADIERQMMGGGRGRGQPMPPPPRGGEMPGMEGGQFNPSQFFAQFHGQGGPGPMPGMMPPPGMGWGGPGGPPPMGMGRGGPPPMGMGVGMGMGMGMPGMDMMMGAPQGAAGDGPAQRPPAPGGGQGAGGNFAANAFFAQFQQGGGGGLPAMPSNAQRPPE